MFTEILLLSTKKSAKILILLSTFTLAYKKNIYIIVFLDLCSYIIIILSYDSIINFFCTPTVFHIKVLRLGVVRNGQIDQLIDCLIDGGGSEKMFAYESNKSADLSD